MMREPSTLEIHLAPLQQFLEDQAVTEIVINKPQEVLTESRAGWQAHHVAALTYDWCLDVAMLVANQASDSVSEAMPLLSAQLPGGERLQVVIPPTVPVGTVSLTIRRPSTSVMKLDEIFASGAFENTSCVQSLRLNPDERATIEAGLPEADKQLLEIFRKKDWRQFLARAILRRKNIIVSGRTGSGKTTLGNALASLISATERLVTVEDVREMRLPHQNLVSMVK